MAILLRFRMLHGSPPGYSHTGLPHFAFFLLNVEIIATFFRYQPAIPGRSHLENSVVRVRKAAFFLWNRFSHSCGRKILSRIVEIGMSWPKKDALSPAAERFVEYVLDRFEECPLA